MEQVCWRYLSNSIGSLCVSVLHLGNSHTMSNLFIIMFATMFGTGSLCVSVLHLGNSHTISNFFIITFAIMFGEL